MASPAKILLPVGLVLVLAVLHPVTALRFRALQQVTTAVVSACADEDACLSKVRCKNSCLTDLSNSGDYATLCSSDCYGAYTASSVTTCLRGSTSDNAESSSETVTSLTAICQQYNDPNNPCPKDYLNDFNGNSMTSSTSSNVCDAYFEAASTAFTSSPSFAAIACAQVPEAARALCLQNVQAQAGAAGSAAKAPTCDATCSNFLKAYPSDCLNYIYTNADNFTQQVYDTLFTPCGVRPTRVARFLVGGTANASSVPSTPTTLTTPSGASTARAAAAPVAAVRLAPAPAPGPARAPTTAPAAAGAPRAALSG